MEVLSLFNSSVFLPKFVKSSVISKCDLRISNNGLPIIHKNFQLDKIFLYFLIINNFFSPSSSNNHPNDA